MRGQRQRSAASMKTSSEVINMGNAHAPVEDNGSSGQPYLRAQSISQLTSQAREMAGGRPDYV